MNRHKEQVKKNLMTLFFTIIPEVPSAKQFFDVTTLLLNKVNIVNFHTLLQILYGKLPFQPNTIYLEEGEAPMGLQGE